MADLVKKIRTESGDLQIDYNALANKPDLSTKFDKSGGTMTGHLTIDVGGASAIMLKSPENSNGYAATGRFCKNANSTADYGIQIRDMSHKDSATGNNSFSIMISNAKSSLAEKIQLIHQVDGSNKYYQLYGEHNKPTLGDLNITATATELNYCDGVTGNIQTQLNGKAASSHGNHVPATQTASNKVFLRNDNTWATVTPANIGAAASSHNHSASNITSGTLSVDRGGTGVTTLEDLSTAIGTTFSMQANINQSYFGAFHASRYGNVKRIRAVNPAASMTAGTAYTICTLSSEYRPKDMTYSAYVCMNATANGASYGFIEINTSGVVKFTPYTALSASGTLIIDVTYI